MKPLQPVDGREADHGIVEGENLPVHGAPGRACALLRKPVGDWLGIGPASHDARLCGHVGEWIGGPDGEEILDLRWFSREELTASLTEIALPGHTSIARSIIEHWYGGPIDDGIAW